MRAARSLSTDLDHGRDGLRWARHQRLDAAVRPVSDPAAQPQACGGTRHPKPVPDALHLAGDAEPNGFHCRGHSGPNPEKLTFIKGERSDRGSNSIASSQTLVKG